MEIENTEKLSVKDRLMIFINSKNLSQGRFEKMANLSNGYINNIRNSISDKIFDQRIAPVFPDLNKMWLLHGEGGMTHESEGVKSNVTSLKSIKDLPHGEQMGMLLDEILKLKIELQEQKKINEDNTGKVIDYIDEYLKPVFDYLITKENVVNKKKEANG